MSCAWFGSSAHVYSFIYNNKGDGMKTKQEIQEAIDEYDTAIDFEQDESEKDKLKAQRMALRWVLEDSRKV